MSKQSEIKAQKKYRKTEKYRKTHRDYNRDRRLKILYGISFEDKIAMWENQNGKCDNPNCGRTLRDPRLTSRSASTKANLDHCHKTGRNRGLLCTGCNAALGHCDDDRHRIVGLILYLNKHQGD